ncbi:glycosyltransferase family 4 protein [Leptospira sp. 'Mane']|uniref:glycosyltransferase family 4 protein n=1 Tax=Leptospira sp. 'Mane' TaxID=3387407 RepID=UPI00398AAAE2
MPIKIGFDARMIENSGIGIRIQHILKFWPIAEEKAELHIFGDPSLLSKYNLPSHSKIIPYTTKIYSIQEWLGHPYMKKMDVLDIPHFNVPIFYIRKCIVTIHDLIPYHFKAAHSSIIKRIYLQFIFRWIKWFARKVIAVSEFTKQDLISEFKFFDSKISVIYNGIDIGFFSKRKSTEISIFQKKYKLPEEYLFTVGIGKSHKNFPFLLISLEEMWKNKSLVLPLVIGGISKKIPNELSEIQKKYKNKIYFLPHLPYSELPLAYQGAGLFVYPSLYEGFGFPVLEAQSVGTPVLSSSASVLPEILQDTAEYFDPSDKEDLKLKIIDLIKNKKKQIQLSKQGETNSKRFLWKYAIGNLKALYESVIEQN